MEYREIGRRWLEERRKEGKTLEQALEEGIELWVKRRLEQGARDEEILRELRAMTDVCNITAGTGVKLAKA